MRTPAARIAVGIVIVASVAGAALRVATAPDHAKERRDVARSVCASAGGEWVRLGGDEFCRQAEPARKF